MNFEHTNPKHISGVLNKLKFKVERGTLSIKDISPVNKPYLLKYLSAHKIPLDLGKSYLAELCVYNKKSGKHFYALGFKNDEDGYEFCNDIVKGYVGVRAIAYIRGHDDKSKSIHIFRDGMDFLSLAAGSENGKLKSDSVIFNSLNLWQQSKMNIYNPKYNVVYNWLNDTPKEKGISDSVDEFCASENIRHIRMGHKYEPHPSIAAWRVHHLPTSE